MVLRVDHHEESMVDTSLTCAHAQQGKSIHPARTRVATRVIVEVFLKFFILMWFESYSPVSSNGGSWPSSVAVS